MSPRKSAEKIEQELIMSKNRATNETFISSKCAHVGARGAVREKARELRRGRRRPRSAPAASDCTCLFFNFFCGLCVVDPFFDHLFLPKFEFSCWAGFLTTARRSRRSPARSASPRSPRQPKKIEKKGKRKKSKKGKNLNARFAGNGGAFGAARQGPNPNPFKIETAKRRACSHEKNLRAEIIKGFRVLEIKQFKTGNCETSR